MRPLSRLLGRPAATADRWALAALVALPILVNLPFALAGHPLLAGDNLGQNFPLRVLSGELIAHGRLPLWDPDVWSGTPLLAGWNAGAMYPGTWLFAFLPGVAAWELNAIVVGVIGGIGLHVFLRRQRCSPVASLLGALTFTWTGFMSGQSVHIGLVTGMAFAPWMLVALDGMARADGIWHLRRWVALLGACVGLVILAGDPRAITNDAIIAFCYVVAVCWRSRVQGRRFVFRFLWAAVAAVVLGAALSAVQWLPGLDFLHQSQRASGRLRYFGAYSLHGGQLAYLVTPFLFGGNGTLGLPTSNFNLPEYTYSVGILPLVAWFVFAARWVRGAVRKRVADAATGVFLVLAVIGVWLSLGTNTPLGHVLAKVPLYGGERLQNRNMGITDLALSVLVALFVDFLSVPRHKSAPDQLDQRGSLPAQWAFAEAAPAKLPWPERVAGAIPPVIVIGLVVAMYSVTAGTEHLLGAPALVLGLPVRMAPYYAFEIAAALGALAVVVWSRWRSAELRRRLAIVVVVADVAMFVGMASYQPAPSSALAANNAATSALLGVTGRGGRSAVLNPQQLIVGRPPNVLDDLGVDDLIVLHHLQSVGGYGSAVWGVYESATGAHEVQNIRPSALLTQTFDELNLKALVIPPELLGTVRSSPEVLVLPHGPPRPAGSSADDRQPGDAVVLGTLPPAGPWLLGPRPSTFFLLPGPQAVDQVVVRLRTSARAEAPIAVTAVLRAGGRRTWTTRVRSGVADVRLPVSWSERGGGVVDLRLAEGRARQTAPSVVNAVAVHVVAWPKAAPVSSSTDLPSLSSTPPSRAAWVQLDGMLQGLLPPDRWRYAGNVGDVLLYRNLAAFGPAWLQPQTSPPVVTLQRAPGGATQLPRAEWQDPVTAVDAPAGGLLVRSEEYAPGWSASIVPAEGSATPGATAPVPGAQPMTRPVVRVGLLQGVRLPPGRFLVTWHYSSNKAIVGALAGLGGLLVLVFLLLPAGMVRRLRRRRHDGPDGPLNRTPDSPLSRSLNP